MNFEEYWEESGLEGYPNSYPDDIVRVDRSHIRYAAEEVYKDMELLFRERSAISQIYTLCTEIEAAQLRIDQIGKGAIGPHFEGAYLNEDGTLTIASDCGHDFDSDLTDYNSKGEEIG